MDIKSAVRPQGAKAYNTGNRGEQTEVSRNSRRIADAVVRTYISINR